MNFKINRFSFGSLFDPPLMASLAITLLLLLLGNPEYETNDDIWIISLLSGRMGLEARPDGIFMSLPLSWLLFKLYEIADAVPWYGILNYLFLFIGFFLGLRLFYNSHLQLANKALLTAGLSLFYMTLFYTLNFAAVSLFLWFMTIAYFAFLNITETQPRPIEALLGLMLGMSYLGRPSIFYIAIIFSLPVAAAFVMPIAKRRLIFLLAPLSLLVMASLSMEFFLHTNPEYKGYQQFNSVRSSFTDTERSSFSEKTPAALAKVDWNQSDYAFAKSWWFHDEAIYGTDKLKTFLAANKESELSLFSWPLLQQSAVNYREYLLVMVLCYAALFFDGPKHCLSIETRQTLVRKLFWILFAATVAGVIILAGIRFPQRVAVPIFGFFIILAVLFRPIIYKSSISSRLAKHLFFGTSFPLLLFLLWSHCSTFHRISAQNKSFYNYTAQCFLEATALNGPETIIVHAIAEDTFAMQFVNPFLESRDMINVSILPLGWLIGSPAYNAFLAKHDLVDRKRVVPSMVNNKNAVFCFLQRQPFGFESFTSIFIEHLERHYGQLFPGKTITLKSVLDTRGTGNGWVFFKVITVPTFAGLN